MSHNDEQRGWSWWWWWWCYSTPATWPCLQLLASVASRHGTYKRQSVGHSVQQLEVLQLADFVRQLRPWLT